METSNIEKAASVFTALGTVAVAIIAVWGDWIKSKIASPILELALVNRSDQTTTTAGLQRIYHHILVRNKRRWSPAKNVRVMIRQVSKKGPDGSFFAEHLVLPLQLTWAFPATHELLPTIGPEDKCDLGSLEQAAPGQSGLFKLSTYIWPNNFHGVVQANETLRVELIAFSQESESKPLFVEISWDGKWSSDREEMQRHLVVKEVRV